MGRILEDISQWPIEKRRAKLEEIYEQRIGVPLNLDNPQRFTEKTQWRKLYENDPRITRCIDKLTFKQYVREKIGDGYTAPLIDVWHSPDNVNLEAIPEKCVIKSNCSGSGKYLKLISCKHDLDIHEMEAEIKQTWFDRRYLNTNSFFSAYYPIKPCVIVEELISESSSGVDEYKLFCFHGNPFCVYHVGNRFNNCELSDHTVIEESFFNLDWNNLGIIYGKHINDVNARKPIMLDEMIKISRILSEDFSFVRVDFYETEERLWLSEMTFTQDGGLVPWYPDSFDYKMGSLWQIKKSIQ